MIFEKKLKTNKIAEAAECSERSIKSTRSNIRDYGTTKAPPNGGGRSRYVPPLMIDALCEHLLEKSGLYLEEMAIFLWDEFNVLVSTSSISRASWYLVHTEYTGAVTYGLSTSAGCGSLIRWCIGGVMYDGSYIA